MSTIVTRAGKGTPLTNNEVDANFVNLNTDKVEKAAAAITGGSIDGTTVGASSPSSGAFTSLTSNSTTTLNGTTIPASKTLLVTTDIGSTVQGYDANTAKLNAAANFTSTLQRNGSNVLVATDIGSTVQGYDVDTTKNDVANTFTAAQTMSSQLNLTNDTDYNLYASGAGANYLAGRLSLGSTGYSQVRIGISGNITGSTNSYAYFTDAVVQSDVTAATAYYASNVGTAAAAFTLPSIRHYQAVQGTFGAGSAVTNQLGYFADTSLTGATNNRAFQGSIPTATGAWNLYMNGTASNYMAGQVGINTTNLATGYFTIGGTQSTVTAMQQIGGTNTYAGPVYGLWINPALTGTTATASATGLFVQPAFAIPASGTITNIFGINANPSFTTTSTVTNFVGIGSALIFGAAAIGNTLTNAYTFNAQAFTINAATTTAITSAAQFNAANIAGTAGVVITLATAFRGRQAATNTGVTNNYNLYMDGAAPNYLAGSLGIGALPQTAINVRLAKNITGATTAYAFTNQCAVQSDVTTVAYLNYTGLSTQATAFTLTTGVYYTANQETFGASSVVTSQTGFLAQSSLIGATNNYAFNGAIPAGTGRYNLYMGGTADNYLAGTTLIGTTTNTLSGKLVSSGQIIETTGSTQYNIVSQFDIGTNANQIPLNQYLGSLAYQNADAVTLTGQLNLTNASNYNLYASGAGANYMAGSLLLGTTSSTSRLINQLNITGATTSYGYMGNGVILSDVTTQGIYYATLANTQASAFTLATMIHFSAGQSTIGATSSVTNQYGFSAGSTLTGATNNYGFRGILAAATGVYNLYMSGTANNYLAGNLGIGTTTMTPYTIALGKNISGAVFSAGIYATGQIQSDVTSTARYFASSASTQATAFTCTNLQHFYASQGTIGATSAVTTQFGFTAEVNLTGATNNYGFYGAIAAATGRYNLYMSGTADNYLAGKLGIGVTPASNVPFYVVNQPTGSTFGYGLAVSPTYQSDVTANGYNYQAAPSTAAAAFTLGSSVGYFASQGTLGAGSAITTNIGFFAATLTNGTNNRAFQGNIAAATNAYNLYMAGSAQNIFSGDVLIFGAGSLGYMTGSGGAVTQGTSRTTGVTLDKTNGAITLFSAAGSATYQSFTVTNNKVAATDTIIVSQKSGTDLYEILITAVAAGSFRITFRTTGGTTTEQPVFNFAVIKAVAA